MGIPSFFDRVSSRAKSMHKVLELARTDQYLGLVRKRESKGPAGCEDLPRDVSKASLAWAMCVDAFLGVGVKKPLKGRVLTLPRDAQTRTFQWRISSSWMHWMERGRIHCE